MKASKINCRIKCEYIEFLKYLWYASTNLKNILDRVRNTFYKTITFFHLFWNFFKTNKWCALYSNNVVLVKKSI